MVIIRVGEGQSPSGKILDRETHWYTLEEKDEAIKDAIKRNRNLYILKNNKKYFKVSIKELKENKI